MNQDKNQEQVFFLFLSYFPIPILLSWWRCSLESSLPLTAVSFQVGTIHRRWRPPLTRHYSLSLFTFPDTKVCKQVVYAKRLESSNQAFVLWIASVVIWSELGQELHCVDDFGKDLLFVIEDFALPCIQLFCIRPATDHFEQEKMFVFKHPI